MAGRLVTQKASFHSLKVDELLVGSSGDAMQTFEQATESLEYSGAITSGSASVKLTRIGDLVTMTIPSVTFEPLLNSILSYGEISANFLPASDTYGYAAVYDNSTTVISAGSFQVVTEGILTIGVGPNLGQFSANPDGVVGQTFSWHAAPL
jgi:hypothetical protein